MTVLRSHDGPTLMRHEPITPTAAALGPGTPRVSGRRGPVCVWAGSFRVVGAMGEVSACRY